jgi:RNA polymerase sigma-70 factor (ECF subfamily)
MAETLVRISAMEPKTGAGPCVSRAALPPSFEELVAGQQARVGRLCYRLLGWQADVEDVVQDVFLAALRALPKFRGESSVSTWITRIAVNTCRSHGRKRRLRILGGSRPEPLRRLGQSAEHELMDRERFEQVRTAVRRLPPKYREAVVLHYLEELAVSEVAAVLGLGKNAVEVRLNRARKWLKEDLAEMLEEPGDEC